MSIKQEALIFSISKQDTNITAIQKQQQNNKLKININNLLKNHLQPGVATEFLEFRHIFNHRVPFQN